MIGETLLHYRILSQIGAGATGALYRAEDQKLKREVMLRLLPSELADNVERLERFRREARAVAALNHPNIVTLHSVEETDGRHFITMEAVAGRPLNQVIPPGGLGLDAYFDLALALADTLATLHEHNLTHRALTSGEVLVSDAGALKVLGFSLTKPVSPPGDFSAAMATDLTAWGLICCEMLLGREMQTEATTRQLQQLALSEDPDFISRWRPEVPVEISRLISQCAQPSSRDNPRTMRATGELLRELHSRLDTGELTFLPLSPEAVQSRKTIVNWTLAFVLLNLLIAILAFFYWKR